MTTMRSAWGGPFVLRDEVDADPLDPDADAAERLALLDAAGREDGPQVVRLLRPAPTAAFSRRDALLPGFTAAQDVARRHGFTPLVRPVGGRMAPYHRGCLVLDVVGRSPDPRAGVTERFELAAGAVVTALRDLGLDARTGAVPREYCPGEHSVNLGGSVKVAGTAQRQARRAFLVSTLLVVEDSPVPARPLRAVTTEVYAALGLDLDPLTVGAVADHAPAATAHDVAGALLAALGQRLELVAGAPARVAP